MPASVKTVTQFSVLTIGLTIGLSAVIATAFRVNVGANWEERRCDPYVVPIAAFFKPSADPRTGAEFATENWNYCQKQYVQRALTTAAQVPKAVAAASAATVGVVQDIASTVADVFFNLWKMCYETYATFMEKMRDVAKLFQKFMLNLYGIVERLNASALSIIYSLLSLITPIVNSIQVTLIVSIIVIGIIIVLQVLLFFFLLPISGLIITVTAMVSVAVVTIATAIAAAMVSELFSPGACFAKGTPVQLASGETRPIETVQIGDLLRDGGRVTAIHQFRSRDVFYNLDGIRVTGDHLIANPSKLIRVSDHPHATAERAFFGGSQDMYCLTTTTRRIPCIGTAGVLLFADWEEIAEDDRPALENWYQQVWTILNGPDMRPFGVTASLTRRASDAVLESEAGLSPDCLIPCKDWLGRRCHKHLRDIRIGDTVYDSPTTTTTVVGKVVIAGNQVTDAVEVGGSCQIMSNASWIKRMDGTYWLPAEAIGRIREMHPIRWEHLYTGTGQFMLAGDRITVRDASDVGLGGLRPLVDSIVLNVPTDSEHTK